MSKNVVENEIEIICVQCEFPVVVEYDENGKVSSFKELEAPQTYEAALADGWLDHGMGLYCPKCSLKYTEDLRRDIEIGATSSVAGDLLEVTDSMALRAICPGLSDNTYMQFTKMFRLRRLDEARAAAGIVSACSFLPYPIGPDQEAEFKKLTDSLGEAYRSHAAPAPAAPTEEKP